MAQRTHKRTRLNSSSNTNINVSNNSTDLSPVVLNSSSIPAPISQTENTLGLATNASKEHLIFSSNKPLIGLQNNVSERAEKLGLKPPPKKLVIRPLKEKPKLPDNYEELTWAKLQKAIRAIHNSQPASDSLEELYKACENLCLHKMANSLYERLKNEIEVHIVNEHANNPAESDIFLLSINQLWKDHQQQMGLIRSIFLYLDRTYVLRNSGIASLWDMGIDLFRKHIMSPTGPLRQKTREGLITLITKERDGESVDRSLLHSLIRMHIDLSIYNTAFESYFLQATRDYYDKEAQRLLEVMEIPEYLHHVQNRLEKESERNRAYLDRKTKMNLIKAVESMLLENHLDLILEKGFPEMMNREQQKDLALLYDLFQQVSALDLLRTSFGVYIKKTGTAIVTDTERDPHMVEDLLDLKGKLDDIVYNSFRKNPNFLNTLKESFETFINQRQNKPAELIAKYLDAKLKANKGMNEDEMDQIMDDALLLFRYIQGKDIFEAFYKRDLAKRLLLNKSASKDAEKSMLLRLKQECGAGFTSKLEGMFKDIDLSRDIIRTFRTSKLAKEIEHTKIELDVNVLTQGFWPTYPPSPANIPPYVDLCQKKFQEFYLTKYAGRNLKWQNSLGMAILSAHFPKKKKELMVSCFQAVVLLQFNDLSPETKELERTLQSLACGKAKVINKHPIGRDINTTDEFSFNEEFEHKLTRIKINSIQLKETSEENLMTTERVFLDRQYQVDAALVRIMKMRKKLGHNQLISELIKQLKFKSHVADIKKRIESLIDREYLERDKEDPTKLIYLA
ncbi:568_t:CDS:10 [Ambispora leptoticha]|uniref:Cullin-4 n=1 Tax=Ambispora leptoticha TaxID=144679 RepID=A0A9N8V009_9GLOM|nr:568_t:CDS:10 [Ambispora leptoticha]